jgi:hypothetical protein
MPTTKYKLAETVLRRLSGGNAAMASKWHINEIKIALEQCLNALLKVESLSNTVNYGETIPNGAAVATYEGIVVEAYKSVSRIELPAIPMKLPRGLGVFQIMPSDDHTCQYIPIEMSLASMLSGQSQLVSGLLGQIGYEVYGNYAQFTADLTVEGEEVTVDVRLIILDMSQYDDWSILPIPADMEKDVVDMVYNMFAGEPTKDSLVDPGTKEQTGVPINQQTQS